MKYQDYKRLSPYTLGKKRAELVLKNAHVVNVFTGEILDCAVAVQDGVIVGVGDYEGEQELDLGGQYLLPGLIDAHLHLESTMVSPNELVSTAARFGTTTFVVDPHEAANVSGAAGIDYILDQTAASPANVYVMMPSCVPATKVDDNGGAFTAGDMEHYLSNPRILGLGEVMDDDAVVRGDREMFEKLDLFQDYPLDGHAPYLPPKSLSAYSMAGIRTDHEATSFDYALKELRNGIHVHIREGSAARNETAIVSGIVKHHIDTTHFSFCTDDKHIEDILREGHINHNVRLAVSLGMEPVAAIQMATIHTARHYGLRTLGAIAAGYQADLVVVDNLRDFRVSRVFHKGVPVSTDTPKIYPCPKALKQTVHLKELHAADFLLPIRKKESAVIGLTPGQITTERLLEQFEQTENFDCSTHPGFQKIAAVERHKNTGLIGVGICRGYGIRGGAIASSVSHDSHNIIVIGDNERDMALAVNEITRVQGGYTVVADGAVYETLPLPIMGLMSDAGFTAVEEKLQRMKKKAMEMGVTPGIAPFIALSFLALPVIPELRITPRGLCEVTEKGPKLCK
ncbi:MAG: adenine deaminase [Oribacterium sp.]